MPMLDSQAISQLVPQSKLMLIEERMRADHGLVKEADYCFTFKRGRAHVLCLEEHLGTVSQVFAHYQIDVDTFHTYK